MDSAAIGAFAGAFVASAVAIWRSEAARRELRGKNGETPNERIAKLETKTEAHDRTLADHGVQLQSVVTDEQFGAYANMTTETIRQLTAEVNRAAGKLEGAWDRK